MKRSREVSWDEGFEPEDPHQGVREAVEKEAEQVKIAALFEGLNADQKMCLVLRAQEGLSYEQIAQALNININTVRSRLKRARETLMALGKGKRGSL
jgi:RNA polymerase sigma-70 factor (ECF subfamily)